MLLVTYIAWVLNAWVSELSLNQSDKPSHYRVVLISTASDLSAIVWLPLTREQHFGCNASGHCLMRVRMLHYLRVGLRIIITQTNTRTMQQTHTHKSVTGHVEAKKLLSRRRQSEYSVQVSWYQSMGETCCLLTSTRHCFIKRHLCLAFMKLAYHCLDFVLFCFFAGFRALWIYYIWNTRWC